MTFPPLASRSDCIEVRKRLNHLHRVETQGPTRFNERYSAQVYPLVKRTFGNADTPGKLIDIDEYLLIHARRLLYESCH